VPAIQALRVQLLDQPLRKVTLASLQHTDKDTSDVPYGTVQQASFKADARLGQTMEHGEAAGA
jgi:hypothetical protein